MCDYSLHAIETRPATVGETLITTTFHGTSTRGFASESEPNVAVCLLPGTCCVVLPAGFSGALGGFTANAHGGGGCCEASCDPPPDCWPRAAIARMNKNRVAVLRSWRVGTSA